jgi:hypothetical protein
LTATVKANSLIVKGEINVPSFNNAILSYALMELVNFNVIEFRKGIFLDEQLHFPKKTIKAKAFTGTSFMHNLFTVAALDTPTVIGRCTAN